MLLIIILPCIVRILWQNIQKLATELHLAVLRNKKGEMLGAGALPMAKVMRKEARHTQRRDRASGVPLEILEHLPPKSESAYFLLCALTYTSDFMGAVPHYLSLKKRVNLQLQLIKFLGVIVFQPTNSFGSPLDCLNRFFRPHVIAQSLPTVRGMRCSKLSKYRFL